MTTTRLTVVVDNQAGDGLIAEHGYSLWIEADGRTILFDTGESKGLRPNSEALGLDLARVTDLVLSHGHYDHTGGIGLVLEKAGVPRVYLHQAALQPRYVLRNGTTIEPVRMPEQSMQALDRLPEGAICWLTHPVQLTERIGITGPIPRLSGFEDPGAPYFFDQSRQRPDLIDDDIAMWLHTGTGLVICVGCAHAGIVNIVNEIIRITGEPRIETIVGGLHLLHAGAERLEQTVQALNVLNVGRLVACHCSGAAAVDYLAHHLACPVVRGHAGLSLSF
ncbi:MAG: MBL fold metallo-hydrolase [Desulfofustis sp.]|nr:MBL fold metallo-hydrolase [Desulfofustis sp.]